MLKKNFLKLLLALGMLGILTTGGIITYPQYVAYQEVVVLEQMQKDLVLPTVRIKGEVVLPDGRVGRIFGSGVVIYSRPNELGTGFDSYALTCNHVVELPDIGPNSTPFELDIRGFKYGVKYLEFFDARSNSIRKVPARVIAHSSNNILKGDDDGNAVFDWETIDPETKQKCGEDAALLKIETLEPLPVCKLPSREALSALKMFDKVRVVGAALADKPIPTFGEITQVDVDFIRINAPAIFGNSGGPCFLDKTHELIGLVNMGRGTGNQFITHMGYIRPMYRLYDWFDKLGYKFIYDKSVSEAEKFNKIRTDRDEQLFKSIDEKAALERQIMQLQKLNQMLKEAIVEIQKKTEFGAELSKMILELKDKIVALEAKIAELEKQLAERVNEPKKEEQRPEHSFDPHNPKTWIPERQF